MQHTKEPWPEIGCDSDDESCITWYTIPGIAKFKCDADAERARACVNACEGIEDVGVVPRMVQAFEIMTRRKWYSVFCEPLGKWCAVFDAQGPPRQLMVMGSIFDRIGTENGYAYWSDPFTALIESEKWFRENIEKGDNQ